MNGIWRVKFASPYDFGEGLVVINDNHAAGGDLGFTYVGELKQYSDGSVFGNIHIQQYDPSVNWVFQGSASNYTLVVSGKVSGDTMSMSGFVAGADHLKLSISGRKLRDI